MNAYIKKCDKCKRPLNRGARKKLTILREMVTGFSGTGFALYLCDECADVAEGVLTKWAKEVR